jgi:hypothetical protein
VASDQPTIFGAYGIWIGAGADIANQITPVLKSTARWQIHQ